MKILSTADIHIHDYAQHNLSDKFRLNQFITLAHRLASIYKEQGCEKIVVSGDSIENATVNSQVLHVLVHFYTILSDAVGENGGEVILQLGNHCKNTRNGFSKSDESIVTILDIIENVRYVNKKVEIIDDLNVGFQDFLPTHTLNWSSHRMDILFNHFTDFSETFGGQEIDRTKFGIMFFGDIHQPYFRQTSKSNEGPIVSIGAPIQGKISDPTSGLCLIIDTSPQPVAELAMDDLSDLLIHELDKTHTVQVNESRSISFEWVDVINEENPFLRMFRPDKKPRKFPNLKYDVEVPYNKVTTSSNSSETDININASLSVDEILNSSMSENSISTHKEVLARAKNTIIDDETISLDFKMISTSIKNYRSIETYTHTYGNNVTRFSGSVGAGKSTVANAIMFNFLGNRNISDQFRDTANPKKDILEVDQLLEYKGMFFRIQRGWKGKGFLKYWKSVDRDAIELNSYLEETDPRFYPNESANKVADIDAMIKLDLPFLQLINLFYISQDSNGLFTDMKTTDRISLISKLLGWNKIVNYSELASIILKEEKSKIAVINTEIEKLTGAIELVESFNIVHDDTNYQQLIDNLSQERSTIQSDLKLHASYLDALQLASNKQSLADAKLATEAPTLSDGTSPTIEDSKDKLLTIKNELATIQNSIELDKERYSNEVKEFLSNKDKIQDKKSQINKAIHSNTVTNMTLDNNYQRALNNLETIQSNHSSLVNAMNIASEKLNEEVKEVCESCGQDVHDEVKIQQANDKRQAYYDICVANVTTSEANIKIAAEALKTASDALLNKVDTITLEANIAKLDAVALQIDAKIKDVKEVDYKTLELQELSNSSNPIVIYINSLNAFDKVIEEGLALSQVAKNDVKEAELIAHLDDNEVEVVNNRSEEILNEINIISTKQAKVESDNKTLEDVEKRIGLRKVKLESIADVESKIADINEYIDLTSFTGPIVQKILERTSEMLSTNTMKVQTIDEKKNGNHKPDLTLSVMIGAKWKKYSQLSGGQRFFADTQFILSLFDLVGGCGLFIGDEMMKGWDEDMINEVSKTIKDAKIRDTLIIIHNSNYPYVDKVVHAELDDLGITHYIDG